MRDRVDRLLEDDELVDEAGEESFPASDPPSWTQGPARHVETARIPERRRHPR